ncbi:hypothetical protein FRC10_004192, partial [Ceratobasidium sp. 414]
MQKRRLQSDRSALYPTIQAVSLAFKPRRRRSSHSRQWVAWTPRRREMKQILPKVLASEGTPTEGAGKTGMRATSGAYQDTLCNQVHTPNVIEQIYM